MPRTKSRSCTPVDATEDVKSEGTADRSMKSPSPTTPNSAKKRTSGHASINSPRKTRKSSVRTVLKKTGDSTGAGVQKKRRRRQSEDAKTRKRKEKRRATLESKFDGTPEKTHKAKKKPKGKKVYNSELKNSAIEWEVEEILDSKFVTKGKKRTRSYLVKWVGYKDTTWEPEINLYNSLEKIAEYDEVHPEKP